MHIGDTLAENGGQTDRHGGLDVQVSFIAQVI